MTPLADTRLLYAAFAYVSAVLSLMFVFTLEGMAQPGVAEQQSPAVTDVGTNGPFLIFTHGEAPSSFRTPDDGLQGPAVEAANCAAKLLGTWVDWQMAPLSRAQQLIASDTPLLWTPATPDTVRTQRRRFLGPVSRIGIFWYMRRDDGRDPHSPDFKREATVTAYPGSRTIDILERQQYRVITGRPDHRGMLDLLFRNRVDALLAVDFRHQLSADMLTRFEDSVKLVAEASFEVGYAASKGYDEEAAVPRLDAFDAALQRCGMPVSH